jgi:hypothetical protein
MYDLVLGDIKLIGVESGQLRGVREVKEEVPLWRQLQYSIVG